MKAKKLFNSICLTLVLIGALVGGLFLSSGKNASQTNAAFTDYTEISNTLPEYLITSGGTSTEDKSIVLLGVGGTYELSIANHEISPLDGKTNYAYKINDLEYYYFNFTNALSLYKDTNNTNDYTGRQNLLQLTPISNFASQHTNSNSVDGLSIPPQKLDISFALGEQFSVYDSEITLTEGLYTLVIPMTRYYTYDGGVTYDTDSSENVQIEYTFMVFNSTTYFNSTTGLQNATMENTENVTLTNNSGYSMFYFYNYSSSKNNLPVFSYNPYVYQLTVNYTDYNQNTFYRKVEYNGSAFELKDENGNIVSENEEYIMTGYIEENNTAYISFNELGIYDISFEYLYRVEGSNEIYELPFDQLITSSTSNIQNNKAQRLYIYGYQAMYTNFNEPVDSATNQRYSRELKTISDNFKTFSQSADITSAFMDSTYASSYPQHSPTTYTIDNIKTAVQTFINIKNETPKNETPITTNQVPIRFLSNVTISNAKLYKVTTGSSGSKSLDNGTAFTNENQNTPGTYVYIITYKFDSYLGQGGVQQSAYCHYQIFYFEITNETPSVTVVDKEGNNFSTTKYTNKSVYLINESTDSPYNADVTIELSIYDYATNQSQTVSFLDLANFDRNTYTYFSSLNNTSDMTAHNGKEAVLINSESANANRRYTIRYRSTMTEYNFYTFTIDTNEIVFENPKMAEAGTDGSYSLTKDITTPTTNSPFAFVWNEKTSCATTYGYVKYFPLEWIDYYSSLQTEAPLNYALLLQRLIQLKIIPVTYTINFSNGSDWSPVENAKGLNTQTGTSIKTDAGLYLLEVYDIAGNTGFYIFVLEDTEPRFIKTTTSSNTQFELLSSSDIIAVSDATVTLNWGDYKAILLQNYSTFDNIQPYPYAYMVDSNTAKTALKNTLSKYTNPSENQNIQALNIISTNIPGTSIPYSNNYLTIEIEDNFAVKTPSTDNFVSLNGNSFQLELLTTDNVANEGTYQILLRDKSNSKIAGNALNSLQSFPSTIMSITVTSDSSELFIRDGNDNVLTQAGFSLTGNFYKDAEENLSKNNDNEEYTETDLTYRYGYYTPITNSKQIKLTFIPFASDGAEVSNITLEYYEYVVDYTADGNYAYYNIASTPATTRTLFDIETTPSGTTGKKQEVNIELGNSEFPLAGRYVITRTYKTQNSENLYDYYERTITIDVDPYNLITPVESVSSNDTSWVESLIGGDIVLSMYSGANQSSIQVSFPFDKNNKPADSFYNKEWSEGQDETPIISVAGSKLPMTLNIPKYKYTVNAYYDETSNSFSVTENNNLSYYGNAYIDEIKNGETTIRYDVYVEGILVQTFASQADAIEFLTRTSITPYEIFAVVEYVNGNNRRYYATDGSSSNGYLTFYEATMEGVDNGGKPIITGNTPIDNFYQAGTYRVTLYQASNQVGSDFAKFYKFAFEITSQAPYADVVNAFTGEILLEKSNSTANHVTTVEYYTNSNSLRFEWEIPTSQYLAKIDVNSITAEYYSSATVSVGETLQIPSLNANSTYFNIDLDPDKITQAGAYLAVSMQFEGHNDLYYNTLRIIVHFDTTAPTQNVDNLINNFANSTLGQFTKEYLWANVRENFSYAETSVDGSNLQNIAYSYTPSAGNYRGFAYTVTDSFFLETLRNTLVSANNYATQNIYYKYIGQTSEASSTYLQNFVSATTKDTFVASAFIPYSADYPSTPENSYGVYEVVEIDSAGNMVTYLVNYIASSNSQEDEEEANAITFERISSNGETLTTSIKDDEIVQGINLYSGTGMSITELNYQNNPWGFYSTILNNGTVAYYLRSPALANNQIYLVTTNNGQKVLTITTLNQIFPASLNSSSTKHSMVFGDSLNGQTKRVYFTIMDANLITNTISNNVNQAILEITVPTANQIASTTIGHVYPVNIEVYQFANGAWQTTPLLRASQQEATYGTWTPATSTDGTITISTITGASSNILRITVNIGSNTKIRYNITDNFGNEITIIQIANEPVFDEITGGNYLYTIAQGGNDILYLADRTLNFSYNTQLYGAVVESYTNGAWQVYQGFGESTSNSIRTLNFASNAVTYNDIYRVYIYDAEDTEHTDSLRTVYLKLYNALPEYSEITNTSTVNHNYIQMRNRYGEVLTDGITLTGQSVNFNGQLLTANATKFTTYSQNVTLTFTDGQTLATSGNQFNQYSTLSYSVYVYDESNNSWTNINSSFDGYQFSGHGQYTILVKYDDGQFVEGNFFTNMCKIFYLEILDSSTIYYHITVDGIEVSPSNILYTNDSGRTFEATYIVGVDYDDSLRVHIDWNEDEEINLTSSITAQYPVADGVYVEEYSYNSTTSSGYFAIIYITPSTNFIEPITYEDATGSLAQIEGNSLSVYATEAEVNFERLKINYKSYYGITQNKINVRVEKFVNGSYKEIGVVTHSATNEDSSYIYLDREGSYRIYFIDSCEPANVHMFGNNQYLTVTFINEVPFFISYNVETGEVDESGTPITQTYVGEKVQKAVYNHPITISLYNISNYFQGYPTITAKKNGQPITISNANATSYTFSEPGYYSISFSAISRENGNAIRQSEYNFTIINANESRYAYSFANYENYYVKSIIRNGEDITQSLINMTDFGTTIIDNQVYLSEFVLSFGDEQTGAGNYQITISSNQSNLSSILQEDFTFNVWINSATPPITISVAEGGSSSGAISVTLNVQNFYNAIGDSYIIVGPNRYDFNSSNLSSYGEVATFQITTTGTWYIQVYSASGDMLYSYKVYKTEPLNAFSIIAIVIAVIVLIIIIIITVKLRKRQRVK